MITGTAGEERKGRCSTDSETEPNTKTSVEKTSMSKNLKQVKGYDSFQGILINICYMNSSLSFKSRFDDKIYSLDLLIKISNMTFLAKNCQLVKKTISNILSFIYMYWYRTLLYKEINIVLKWP